MGHHKFSSKAKHPYNDHEEEYYKQMTDRKRDYTQLKGEKLRKMRKKEQPIIKSNKYKYFS